MLFLMSLLAPEASCRVLPREKQNMVKNLLRSLQVQAQVVYTLNNFWAYEQYWACISYLLKRLELLFGPK